MHKPTEIEQAAENAELRRRVARLERQVAGYQRFVRQMADLSPRVAGVRGPFFRAVVETVADHLGADCVIIGELDPTNQTIQSLATYQGGEFGPDLTYPLAGAPCEQVI